MISSIEAHSDTNHYIECLWSPYGLFQTNNLHVPAYTLTHLSTKLSDVLRTQVYCRGAKHFLWRHPRGSQCESWLHWKYRNKGTISHASNPSISKSRCSASPPVHFIGSEKYVVTFARGKLFELLGRDQKSMRGIQQQALSGRTRKHHPCHLWHFFAFLEPSSVSMQKSRSWEANSCTLDQTIPRPLRSPCSQELVGSICWVKRIPATLPTLSLKHPSLMEFSLLHNLLTRGPYPSKFSMWNLCLFIIFIVCYTHLAASYPLWCNKNKNKN